MQDLLFFSSCLGLVSGLLAGLFGLGGGVVIVPGLVWLYQTYQFPADSLMRVAIATSLATIIPTALASSVTHYRLGHLDMTVVFRLFPGMVLGAGFGSWLAEHLPGEQLRLCFIAYLLYVAFKMAYPRTSSKTLTQTRSQVDYWMGGFIGSLSALIGIGGGTLTVPYLLKRQFSMQQAVAISSACGLPIAGAGVVAYIILGWYRIDLPDGCIGYVYTPAFFSIIFFSMVMAPLGAKLAHRLPAQRLKRYFGGVLFIIAINMMTH
jgi:uncharacterized membrane protein YfcA